VWHHIFPLTEVTDEDIMRVVAEKVSLLQRELAKDHDFTSFSPDAWRPREVKTSASPVKSIHHFCVLPDGLQLPIPYRGVWQQHHRQVSFESFHV